MLPSPRCHSERRVSSSVVLTCIAPDARETLDAAMAQWAQHRKGLPPRCRRSVYSFAYWLIRWSGLVVPAPPTPREEAP